MYPVLQEPVFAACPLRVRAPAACKESPVHEGLFPADAVQISTGEVRIGKEAVAQVRMGEIGPEEACPLRLAVPEGSAFAQGIGKIGKAQVRLFEMRLQEHAAGKAAMAQAGTGKPGLAKEALLAAGFGKVAAREVALEETDAREMRFLEVAALEGGEAELDIGEVHAREIVPVQPGREQGRPVEPCPLEHNACKIAVHKDRMAQVALVKL